MRYFKTQAKIVMAVDNNQEFLIQNDWIELTIEEVEAYLNPPKTQEQLQQEINTEAKNYLAETDWYVIREAETGVAVPDEVSLSREKARLQVKDK